MSDRKLAISISRCEDVERALQDSNHPCRTIIDVQKDVPSRHVPEGWFGNLPNAKVLFIASNPSIDRRSDGTGENYPRAHWLDDQIGEWITRRADQTWNEAPVTFNHSEHKNFLWRCEDGKYRGSGKKERTPQRTWSRTHAFAEEIIGASAHPGENYALTEVVHCKGEDGIGVKQAAMFCTSKWFNPVMETASQAKIVVLLGSKVRDHWKKVDKSLPKDFGGKRSGVSKPQLIRRDTFVNVVAGISRVYIYLPHPSSSGEKGETMSIGAIYGPQMLGQLQQIVEGTIPAPLTSTAWYGQFS